MGYGFTGLKEKFIETYTDDPVVWLKWIVCLVVLVIAYILVYKLYCRVDHAISRERKRDKAKALNHVIQGKLVKSWISTERESDRRNEHCCHATYEYELNGKVRKYNAMFYNSKTAPRILYLYYINNPNRVFAVDDYHWEAPKGILLGIIMFLPWICAALTAIALKIPMQ